MQVPFIHNQFLSNIVNLWLTVLLNCIFVNKLARIWILSKQEDSFLICFTRYSWICSLVILLVVSLLIHLQNWDKEEIKLNKIKKENVSFVELKNKHCKRLTKTWKHIIKQNITNFGIMCFIFTTWINNKRRQDYKSSFKIKFNHKMYLGFLTVHLTQEISLRRFKNFKNWSKNKKRC